MHRLLHAIGDPHHKLKLVHVAGTKGKGSTTAMLASVLQAAQYSVGTYTRCEFMHLSTSDPTFVLCCRCHVVLAGS